MIEQENISSCKIAYRIINLQNVSINIYKNLNEKYRYNCI